MVYIEKMGNIETILHLENGAKVILEGPMLFEHILEYLKEDEDFLNDRQVTLNMEWFESLKDRTRQMIVDMLGRYNIGIIQKIIHKDPAVQERVDVKTGTRLVSYLK